MKLQSSIMLLAVGAGSCPQGSFSFYEMKTTICLIDSPTGILSSFLCSK